MAMSMDQMQMMMAQGEYKMYQFHSSQTPEMTQQMPGMSSQSTTSSM